MRIRCRKCNGHGGWVRRTLLGEVFLACAECLGKGSRWTNHKRKKKSAPKGHR